MGRVCLDIQMTQGFGIKQGHIGTNPMNVGLGQQGQQGQQGFSGQYNPNYQGSWWFYST